VEILKPEQIVQGKETTGPTPQPLPTAIPDPPILQQE